MLTGELNVNLLMLTKFIPIFMRSYTINLLRSIERRSHVDKQLYNYHFINNEYIEGVDASLLSDQELQKNFNNDLAILRYGRPLKRGEIGCTLSHRKCYDTFLKSSERSVIIFEDDILIQNLDIDLFQKIQSLFYNIEEPCILLLSGSFWYTKKKRFYYNYELANVYSAYFTHSYIINRSAASIILEMSPAYLADDWRLIKKKGIRLLGIHPHIVDQKDFPSLVNDENRGIIKNNLSFMTKCTAYKEGLMKKILRVLKHYEQKAY